MNIFIAFAMPQLFRTGIVAVPQMIWHLKITQLVQIRQSGINAHIGGVGLGSICHIDHSHGNGDSGLQCHSGERNY